MLVLTFHVGLDRSEPGVTLDDEGPAQPVLRAVMAAQAGLVDGPQAAQGLAPLGVARRHGGQAAADVLTMDA